MSLNRSISATAIAAGLGLAMSMGGAMPSIALAADGTVKIASTTANQNAKYDGYRIFVADVDANDKATNIDWASTEMKTAVLAYLDAATTANSGVSQTYTDWLDTSHHTAAVDGVSAHDIAQNAAEYISAMISASTNDTDAGTTPATKKGNTFANGLARHLAGANGISPVTGENGLAAGTNYTGAQGYYLFVTHDADTDDTIGIDEAGTAPIWVAVGTTAKSITEKASIPTVDKKVKEDSGARTLPTTYTALTSEEIEDFVALPGDEERIAQGYFVNDGQGGYKAWTAGDSTEAGSVFKATPSTLPEWGISADANRNQAVQFQLKGTVADNVNSFETYYYEFEDSFTNLTLDATVSEGNVTDGVTVKIDGKDVTTQIKSQAGAAITYANNKLNVVIPDLLKVQDPQGETGTYLAITKNTEVTVDYSAHLNDSAVMGSTGNPNTVKLKYSSDPAITSKHTETTPKTVKTFMYGTVVTKVDEDTREPLNGAKFSIQVASSNTDQSSVGKYVKADGTLVTVSDPTEANLQAAGALHVTAGQGTFTVTGLDEGVYTIHEISAPSSYKTLASDVTLTVTSVRDASGELTGLNASIAGGNGLFVNNPGAHQDGITGTSVGDGQIGARVSDKKETTLPGTGLTTTHVGIVAGIALVIGGLFGVTRRKKNGKAETETEGNED